MNRSYNSGLGRFTQVDPIGMGAVSPGDPQSLNLYAYCQNDPINHTDTDGLDGGATLAVFVVLSIISAIRGIIGNGGSRARTAPIVQKVNYRSTAQISNRAVWTNAGIQAGVGAVSAFLQDPISSDEIQPYIIVTKDIWTIKADGTVTYEGQIEIIHCETWKCWFDAVKRGRGIGYTLGKADIQTPIGFAAAAFKIKGLKGLRGAAKATKAIEKVSKNIKKIDDKYLKKLGVDAHQIKKDHLGKKAPIASYDLYTDSKTGEILIFKKGGLGDAIRTGEFIK